jgi:RHS repeat-associated protein
MTSTDYNDNTPDIAITYDSFGRRKSVTNTLASSTFEYAADLGVDTETITYTLSGQDPFTRVLDRRARSLGRDTGWELGISGADLPEHQASYGYNPTTGFLETVAGGVVPDASTTDNPHDYNAADTFTYGYTYTQAAAGDPRVGATNGTLKQDFMPYTLTKNGGILKTIRTYEATRDVLVSIQNIAGTTVRSAYDYSAVNGGVNNLGQRMGVRTTFNLGTGITANAGDTSWGYDDLGQLTSADAPDLPGAAENDPSDPFADRGYAYDTIGNRLFSETSNSQISNPRSINTTGYTPNALNQYDAITPHIVSGNAVIPGTPVVPVFDDDGNMTHGPLPVSPGANCTLVWDAENRLIEVKNASNVTLVQYAYDALSRRISRSVTGSPTTLYLYDGFNCIAEYTGTTLAKARTWGMDLSGAMQGAGGVGGLLAEKQGSNTFYPTYDGNGNISEYLEADGDVAAHFEYDPFGNTVVDTDDAIAPLFAYRFSTKPIDFKTGLYYYSYRWYDPVTGRWPSRDPIEERGGINLYGFVGNDGMNKWDVLGRIPELSIGGSASAGILIGLWGVELSMTSAVTSKCRSCVTYAGTAMLGPGATGYAGFSLTGAYSPSGSLEGSGLSHGIGGALGGGVGATGNVEYNSDPNATGGSAAAGRIGPVIGGGFAVRKTFSCTRCAEIYLYGPLAPIKAAKDAWDCVLDKLN